MRPCVRNSTPWTAAPAGPLSGRFWAPNPRNVLRVDRHSLTETRRLALVYRNATLTRDKGEAKAALLRVELDRLVTEGANAAADIARGLDALREIQASSPGGTQPNSNATGASELPASTQPQLPTSTPQTSPTYRVAVSPSDPSFAVRDDFRLEFLADMYLQPNHWLPSYGPWYAEFTERAMHARVFPSELRGKANFHNSTSHKLMQALTTTVTGATDDFYTDSRNLSDMNAGLCLLGAYYALRSSTALPLTRDRLFDNLDDKVKSLTEDLRRSDLTGDFFFNPASAQQAASTAPLQKESRYAGDFFGNHRIFQLFKGMGLFPEAGPQPVQGAASAIDLTYSVTSAVFGPEIPPFMSYQWNLRVGLVALEFLVLVYVSLDTAQVSPATPRRRLNLRALLGNKLSSQDTRTQAPVFLKRGQLFSFIARNYIAACLKHRPNGSASWLFPGIVLVALESEAPLADTARPTVDLTGSTYTLLLQTITQRMLIKDATGLVEARTKLRLQVEDGLARALGKTSPATYVETLTRRFFGAEDNYDMLYFIILGFLPVAAAVV